MRPLLVPFLALTVILVLPQTVLAATPVETEGPRNGPREISLQLQLRQARPGRGGESATLKPLIVTQRVPNPAR
jgi:hypothetical protein